MKKYLYISLIACVTFLGSCEKYLDKVEESDDPTADEIYSEYFKFQGMAFSMYNEVVSPIFWWGYSGSFAWWDAYSDESYNSAGWTTAFKMNSGDYWGASDPTKHGVFSTHLEADDRVKIWRPSWRGIRTANLIIQNSHRVLDADPAELANTVAEAYYFRAYFHFLLGSIWGGLPYTDEVFAPDDDMLIPRLSYHDMTMRIVHDLDTAALLLPNEDSIPSSLKGRISSGTCKAVKARALLYDASPLITEAEGLSAGEKEERWILAAQANYEMVMLGSEVPGSSGTYALVDGDDYRGLCVTSGGGIYNSESVLLRVGLGSPTNPIGMIYGASPRYGNSVTNSPTQNLVDKFEMLSTGLPIRETGSGYDDQDPYTDRDPRFYNAILTNGEPWGLEDNETMYTELYAAPEEGREKTDAQTGYMARKLWPNPAGGEGFCGVAMFRLAEFYLNYAEAVNEVYGPNGALPGSDLTAVQAINIIRNRVGMPDVDARFINDKNSFRERIQNEKAVEFCFENHRWFDMRRWKIATNPELKSIYRMDITVDADNNNEPLFYAPSLLQTRIFEEKHYWLPLPRSYVFLSSKIEQNPGW